MGFKTDITKLHYEKEPRGLFFSLLKFCSLFYASASGFKNFLYDRGFLKPKKVGAYVISVGNLTTGGVGKTPVVAEIARYFSEKGEKVAIVSRGYGSKLKGVNVISDGEKIFFDSPPAADEALWLAKNTKAVVITSPKRFEGAEFALQKFRASKIILDDGFQHRKLHRDFDIVLVDSDKGFGNENLLPAGPLREGPEAFGRVDSLIVVSKNTDHSRAEKYAKIMGKKLKKNALVCALEPDFAYNIFKPEVQLKSGESVIAFSAIGQPGQFYKFLGNYLVQKTLDFDDHHIYTQADANNLKRLCADLDVKSLVTTEKDAQKLMGLDFGNLDVFALKLSARLNVENLFNEEF